ncbi:putative flavonoid 3'-monooxygenase [Helianthus anomalus]
MIARTETSATTIEWAMSNIMQNHNIIKKIQEELVEIVGLNNIVEEYHLPKLKYMEATIKETLRMHPIVPFLNPTITKQGMCGRWIYHSKRLFNLLECLVNPSRSAILR